MQAHHLHTLHSRFQSGLGALPDSGPNSLCLYSSTDRVHFHAYPQPSFGFPTSTFANVLPELRTRFAVQATDPFIRAAIESATNWTMVQHEVEIGCGYSVRIVDDAAHLPYAAEYCQPWAFVRADACLVVWADCVDTVMSSWGEITRCLQSRFGGALLHSNPMAGLPGNSYGSLGMDQFLLADPFDFSSGALQTEGSSQPSVDTLSSLNEFSFLATVHGPVTPSPTLASASYDSHPYAADPAWPWGQSESPGMGVLQLALQTLNTSESSPANDMFSYSFGDAPLTVSLASISPPPVGVSDLSREEDPTSTASPCGISLGFSTPASDGAISPASFSQSPGMQQQQQQHSLALFTDAAGPLSFRRHSVGAASGPSPSPRVVGKKTKRDGDDGDGDDDDNRHYGYNYIDDDSYFPAAAGVHAFKRRRAAGGVVIKATSAPARFTVPLPNVERVHEKNDDDDDDDDGSSVSSSSLGQALALPTPVSASTSTASLVPSPTSTPAPTSTSKPAPAPAPRRARRRARTSRGRARDAERPRCEFCKQTFSRAQDAQRHAATSCVESPNKEGVECPECSAVLSRIDAAQRHWRRHENLQFPPPEWANVRA